MIGGNCPPLWKIAHPIFGVCSCILNILSIAVIFSSSNLEAPCFLRCQLHPCTFDSYFRLLDRSGFESDGYMWHESAQSKHRCHGAESSPNKSILPENKFNSIPDKLIILICLASQNESKLDLLILVIPILID